MKHQHLFRQWLIGCLCCYAVTVQGQTSLVQLVDIPAGQFYMGGIGQGENFDEAPVHRVTISRPVLISAHEFTNEPFAALRP